MHVMGSSMIAFGLLLAFIMNLINKREYERIMAYVTMQAEAMRNDQNSRQRFNEQYDPQTHNENGPNGLH